MSVEMTADKVDELLENGFKCRDCKEVFGTYTDYNLNFWQWLMLVGESGWLISPEIVYRNAQGEVTGTEEAYNLCHRHNI